MTIANIELNLNLILSARELEKFDRESLRTAFYLTANPLELAKRLHDLAVPERITGQLVAEKIELPSTFTADDAMLQTVKSTIQAFWQRLGAAQESAR
ncbi:MAG: hypothetical protein WCC18_18605 [Candidatus Acidiferrales bacterium]